MKKIPDRNAAGRALAKKLENYKNNSAVIVLALPRGGVPVGYQISQQLKAKLDVFLVRKLGVPGQEELAFGALAIGNIKIFNQDILNNLNITDELIESVILKEKQELERRNDLYRHGKPLPPLKNKIVILVDDGLATGATMRAAVVSVKQQEPARIVIAVPVAPYETYLEFLKLVDEIICLEIPEPFYSISLWYDEFSQTSDEEVCELLDIRN